MTIPSLRAQAAMHLAIFLFGGVAVLAQALPQNPLMLVFWRSLFAALSVAALLRWQGQPLWQSATPRRWLSGVLLAVHWLLFFAALKAAPLAYGLLGFASFPLFVAALEPYFFNERRHGRDALAAVAVVAGMVLMVWPDSATGQFDSSALLGLLLGIGAGGSFALLIMLNRANSRDLSAIRLTFLQNAGAAACLLPLVLLDHSPATPSWAAWGGVVLLGVVLTALPQSLLMFSLQSLSTRFVSLMSTLEPVYGIALAWAWLGQRPTAQMLAGAGVILAATTVVTLWHSPHV
ncbi:MULTISPECIES: DMT family transporter [unclassified Undibacterium]|uniref:DMT family transporter n=2 Tax=Pseudomonadati TaxID=3379134 RepID=UPI002AC985FA|nr:MULTISPECIES: DMT family transporter [unclassified Undibacterium]MEB0140957.1 DMT family transporter [Undibacterium sp. CCC2.1]MEB0173336.1 DMT family transporter [Undibacterium sp. CCC1.1]MEB0177913.1 DMT family transporter [Undibacterium sp. CCC3.4]MEB0217155.1 DMT family transporter [Undibacterium sp. 5I2]WPX43106.1 DMT family transporter [Undibacterium sp. CCC3.4]